MRLSLTSCIVRSWEPDDVPSLVRHANNRRIWSNLRDRFPHPYTTADGNAFIRRVRVSRPETTPPAVASARGVTRSMRSMEEGKHEKSVPSPWAIQKAVT